MSISHLPDEVLFEIFDYYLDPYHLREQYVWFSLTHVCRKWRAVMVASSFRLDLRIIVGPQNPGHIETILSSPLQIPIFFDYKDTYGDMTDSSLWRLRAALGHHDHVREVVFGGSTANFDKFFEVTKCVFPVLENLSLCGLNQKVPDTFLGGPDRSDLHLRRLKLSGFSLESTSRLLSSATSLTDLFLDINTVSLTPEISLLVCLQGLPHLRRLALSTLSCPLDPQPQPKTFKDEVSISKLTHFRYAGNTVFLNAFMALLLAPSLRDIKFWFIDRIWPHFFVHIPQVIKEIKEYYHAVKVEFQGRAFRLWLLTKSEYILHHKPHLELNFILEYFPQKMEQVADVLLMRYTVQEFVIHVNEFGVKHIPWHKLYQQFPRVKALRTEGVNNTSVARTLQHSCGDDDDFGHFGVLPALEEIDLGKSSLADESQRKSQLAAFELFVSARRRQVGRSVKVFFSP